MDSNPSRSRKTPTIFRLQEVRLWQAVGSRAFGLKEPDFDDVTASNSVQCDATRKSENAGKLCAGQHAEGNANTYVK